MRACRCSDNKTYPDERPMPQMMSIRRSVRERGRRLFHEFSAAGFSQPPCDLVGARCGLKDNPPRGPAPGPAEVSGVLGRDLMTMHELKFHAASQAQRQEIIRHRDQLSQHRRRAVSLDEAARDWIGSHAADWRARFEVEWRESASA